MDKKRKTYQPDEKFGFTGIEGVSLITGWSKSSIYKNCAKKFLPHYKIGGKVIFKIEEIISFIENGKCEVAVYK